MRVVNRVAHHQERPEWVTSTPKARPSGTRPRPTEAESFKAARAWGGVPGEGAGGEGRAGASTRAEGIAMSQF
ncbi:hypothetical protein GCM10010341_64010 [Streptomyces noursei]|nr:hypothetical protein GCM10010341_64010 [Streptomyces noursei]